MKTLMDSTLLHRRAPGSRTGLAAPILIMALVMGCMSIAHGSIVYDGLEAYAPGALNGQGAAGDGWTAGWTQTFGDNSAFSVVAGGLNYNNGDISINGGNRALQVGTSFNSTINRPFTSNSSDPLYFSFLFRNTAGLNSSLLLGGHLSNNQTPTTNYGAIGKLATPEFSARLNEGGFDTTSSSTTIAANTTYFLVGRLSKDGTSGDADGFYDQLEMWINPNSANLGTPDVIIDNSMGISGGLTHFMLRYNNASASAEYLLDEFRITENLHQALGIIPEPTTALLLMMGAGLFLWRRRGVSAPHLNGNGTPS
jgi:hypothetical protein